MSIDFLKKRILSCTQIITDILKFSWAWCSTYNIFWILKNCYESSMNTMSHHMTSTWFHKIVMRIQWMSHTHMTSSGYSKIVRKFSWIYYHTFIYWCPDTYWISVPLGSFTRRLAKASGITTNCVSEIFDNFFVSFVKCTLN